MTATSDKPQRFLLNGSVFYSCLETLLIASLLSISVWFSTGVFSSDSVLQVMVIGPLSAMYLAGRMRLHPSGLAQGLGSEVAIGAVVFGLISVMGLVSSVPRQQDESLTTLIFGLGFLGVWNFLAYAFFRSVAYLWPVWVRMRRAHLRWEMTHAIMLVVAPFLAALLLVLMLLLWFAAGGPIQGTSPLSPASLVNYLPYLGIYIFLTVVGMIVLLPPAAFASYIAARKTASRLESLSHATGGLRAGNYSVRVPISGEDEVATVERDFNLMAANLENAMAALRSERDNVSNLLQTQRELVASVSHELRTPITTMRGYLESALSIPEEDIPETIRPDLVVMSGEVSRLQRLVDDLFVLSRAEIGQLSLQIQPTSVAAVIDRVVAAASERAWRTGRVEVISNIEPGLPRVTADPDRLEQVLHNLVSNGVRHTPPGGIVAVSAEMGDATIRIDVTDTGTGIEAEDLERIFDRFQRLDDARMRDASGAGLGLAIVRELTGAMGGTVSVQSEPGSGSCFSITLPVAPSA